jgi:hypothetical protein
MKTSNKLLLAILVGFLIAMLANNLLVKVQYKKIVPTTSAEEPRMSH